MNAQGKQPHHLRNVIIVAAFSALAAVGGLIKLPSPVGSIALDSAPGFFVAGFYSPILGGITGFLGHLASAATAGFPFGFIHLLIGFLQLCWCYLFGAVVRKGNSPWALLIAGGAAVLANGIAAPLILAALFATFRPILSTLIPSLLVATAVNVGIAIILIVIAARLKRTGNQ